VQNSEILANHANLVTAGVPKDFETGTALIIDPSKIKSADDLIDAVIGCQFFEGTEVDPTIPYDNVTHIVATGVGSSAEVGGNGTYSKTGDPEGHWWADGTGNMLPPWVKWLTVGLMAALVLYKTYPWWGQKLKYMIQKCKNGKSLASMEFSTDDFGGERGEDYRFRYDFRYSRWILEYRSMKVFKTKTFPSPDEVEQFLSTEACRKFVSRCSEILYGVIDDEAFEGFVDFLKEKDNSSYEFCKQLLDGRVHLHRTFETMKVKYL